MLTASFSCGGMGDAAVPVVFRQPFKRTLQASATKGAKRLGDHSIMDPVFADGFKRR